MTHVRCFCKVLITTRLERSRVLRVLVTLTNRRERQTFSPPSKEVSTRSFYVPTDQTVRSQTPETSGNLRLRNRTLRSLEPLGLRSRVRVRPVLPQLEVPLTPEEGLTSRHGSKRPRLRPFFRTLDIKHGGGWGPDGQIVVPEHLMSRVFGRLRSETPFPTPSSEAPPVSLSLSLLHPSLLG